MILVRSCFSTISRWLLSVGRMSQGYRNVGMVSLKCFDYLAHLLVHPVLIRFFRHHPYGGCGIRIAAASGKGQNCRH